MSTSPPLNLTRAAALVGSIQRLTVGKVCAQTLKVVTSGRRLALRHCCNVALVACALPEPGQHRCQRLQLRACKQPETYEMAISIASAAQRLSRMSMWAVKA